MHDGSTSDPDPKSIKSVVNKRLSHPSALNVHKGACSFNCDHGAFVEICQVEFKNNSLPIRKIPLRQRRLHFIEIPFWTTGPGSPGVLSYCNHTKIHHVLGKNPDPAVLKGSLKLSQ